MKRSEGSTVLVLLIVMSGVVALTLGVWRTMTFAVDATRARQLQYQAFYCAEGLRKWGVKFVIENFDALHTHLAQRESLHLDMSSWPIRVATLQSCTCWLNITRYTDNAYKIDLSFTSDNASCHSSCCVERVEQKEGSTFYIRDFSIHNREA